MENGQKTLYEIICEFQKGNDEEIMDIYEKFLPLIRNIVEVGI